MNSLARPATDLLVQYARYHRDRRNIATHFVGIPLIVFGLSVLLARPEIQALGVTLTPIIAIWLLSTLWLINALLVIGAVNVSDGASTGTWLLAGVGAFVVGWVLQFIGHWYEGRKPAFVDDLVGLLVGPMFVTAEAMFATGWGKALLAEIERAAGPTYLRNLHPGPNASTR
ncbi:MAG: DUF962 domain-containing protein [Ideonella sp.]|nr:DUF962 domain-containing protein [Ideonella sp.]